MRKLKEEDYTCRACFQRVKDCVCTFASTKDMQAEWVSVDERLPEERPYRIASVLIAKENGAVNEALYNTKTGEFWKNASGDKPSCAVTDWQYLPEHPLGSKPITPPPAEVEA